MRALLRQLWAEPRAPDPPPVGRGDVALLLVVLGVAAVEVALRPELELGSYHVVAAFVVLPMLLGRRAQPLLMVALTFGGLTLGGLVATAPGSRPPAPDATAFVLMLPYALLRWGSGREVLAGVVVLAATIGLDQWWAGAPIGDVLGGLAVVSASTAFGASARFRERVRRQELAYVRLGERERLARDLHDTVAHHVSAIAIQAQAGLAGAPHRPAAATEALAVISAEASRTLAEMRAMVHVLREAEGVSPSLTPAPSVTDLAQLAQVGGAGPAIEVELRGDLGALLPAVSSALFRVGQESITNTRRHARHATRVVVQVVATPHAVTLVADDDGEPVEPRPPGLGLRGMLERAELLGGRCRAGPGPERGWRVEVTLPRGEPRT